MHPLDPLDAAEIAAASRLIKGLTPGRELLFKNITLIEPPKPELRKYLAAERSGAPTVQLARRVSSLYYYFGTNDLFVTTLNLSTLKIEKTEKLGPAIYGQSDPDETLSMRDACLRHPRVIERIKQYGLPDDMEVVCNTWPYGRDDAQPHPRYAQCYLYARSKSHPGSNSYDNALPFSPIMRYMDNVLEDIVELPIGVDNSTTPEVKYVEHTHKEWHPDLHVEPKRSDLKPLTVHQPEGASFTVDGHLVQWQKWRFRVGFNWREGMVLHDVTYDGRELFHRLSMPEMFVPYGDPRTPYSRKSVFDVGDIGAGVAANNLALGCDCLGLIKYFSFTLSDSKGNPSEKHNAICMHEIDDGIGWKHSIASAGLVSIVRSRVLILQSIITVGNYDYIFMWSFDQAAGLHYRIQATGILSTTLIAPGVTVPWGVNVNDTVLAPNHQHVFSLRIDPSLDGDKNSFVEEDSLPLPFNSDNPQGVGFITKQRVITESSYSEDQLNRIHKIINPTTINRITQRPVSYVIHSPIRQMLIAHPDSWHSRRAKYATQPYWVTSYRDGELFPAGNYTYQSLPEGVAATGGDLQTWVDRKDKVDNEDIVVWHTISLTHNPRPEDYPVMPVETLMVSLKPSGFFEQNPALDVPQSTQKLNQSVLYDDVAGQTKQAPSCCPKL